MNVSNILLYTKHNIKHDKLIFSLSSFLPKWPFPCKSRHNSLNQRKQRVFIVVYMQPWPISSLPFITALRFKLKTAFNLPNEGASWLYEDYTYDYGKVASEDSGKVIVSKVAHINLVTTKNVHFLRSIVNENCFRGVRNIICIKNLFKSIRVMNSTNS